MTRAAKKAARSTKRDLFAFELVEKTLKTRSQTSRDRENREESREKRDRDESRKERSEKRDERNDAGVKKKATASQSQKISSNIEFNTIDDNFNDLVSSDEKFEALENLDENFDA